VIDLKPGSKQGTTLVNIEVTTADAPTVAALAADDRIVLALAGN
jgi:hemolysin activation/secretion protein